MRTRVLAGGLSRSISPNNVSSFIRITLPFATTTEADSLPSWHLVASMPSRLAAFSHVGSVSESPFQIHPYIASSSSSPNANPLGVQSREPSGCPIISDIRKCEDGWPPPVEVAHPQQPRPVVEHPLEFHRRCRVHHRVDAMGPLHRVAHCQGRRLLFTAVSGVVMARPAHAHGVRVTDTSLQADIDDLIGFFGSRNAISARSRHLACSQHRRVRISVGIAARLGTRPWMRSRRTLACMFLASPPT